MFTVPFNLRLPEDQVDSEPEVELISLITEKLPHYKLRADYSVRFSGYQNSDFNRAERVKEQITELTNDQIHQTLEYFILCGLRVNRMTETYEDCQALTLLVQEQRSHLDLAANIGLNLVEKNSQLEQRVMSLEEQLDASKETMKQMRHQLTLKDDLLRMFHSEIEESDDQDVPPLEVSDTVFVLDKVNVKQLESKLSRLEEENLKLRHQQQSITTSTDLLESKETQLVNDCVTHIMESTKTIDRLSVELNKKTNDYLNQHEEISRLLTSKIDLENKTHHLLTENDNLITQLRDHQTKEFTLTKEIADMRDRYDECINLLNEKQDEIRLLKKKIERLLVKQVQYFNSSSPEPDMSRNLALELEESCKRGAEEMDHSRTMRIMEAARALNTSMIEVNDDETSSGFTEDIVSSMMHTEMTESISPEQLSGNYLLRRSIQDDCERRRLLRRPGGGNRPGSYQTSSTLTARSPSSTFEDEYLTEAMYHRHSSSVGLNSLNTSIINHTEAATTAHNLYKFPDKLQLIKPIEGSQTLRVWQNLATPSLTKALFEEQPHGVCFRGQQMPLLTSPMMERSRDRDDQRTSTSSDYDDDIDYEEPAPTIRAKDPESHSTNYSYSHSRMFNTEIAPPNNSTKDTRTTSIQGLDGLSSYPSQRHIVPDQRQSSSSYSSVDYHDSTPVNDVNIASVLTNHGQERSLQHTPATTFATSSWLDRFTVGSIMTSILGYSRPVTSTIFTSASNNRTYSTSTTSITSASSSITSDSVHSDSSLIGRLTNLPPLAKRKPMQRKQSGLNLLTSLAPSSIRMAIHRADTEEDTDQCPGGRQVVD